LLNTNGAGPEAGLPAPRAFDRPLSQRAVLRAVGATNFIQ